jgi:glycosyltransferase involved in cell wall biosynthesis
MRVLITADPYLPVPPRCYGGIERAIALLVDGLTTRGHEVTLIAHPDSTAGTIRRPYGKPPHVGVRARMCELGELASLVWANRDADVIHSFGRLAALAPVLPLRHLRKVQTYQRPVPWNGVRRARVLAGDSLLFTGCSSALYRDVPPGDRSNWRTVYNAIDPGRFNFVPQVSDDAPLVFLGRLEWIKGVHHAIAIARTAGRRLVIAGNLVDHAEGRAYFAQHVAPHLDDVQVKYVGEVDDAQKNVLLGSAAALLMPIEWEEPFGIVMIEALACGTPVIGFRRGAVPEVVRHGQTGFVCDAPSNAVEGVAKLSLIDRGLCRRDVEERFSANALVDGYERVYGEFAA